MADMPAETSDSRPAARSGAAGRGLDMSFLVGFGSLPIVRQVGLMIGLAASVALGFAVVLCVVLVGRIGLPSWSTLNSAPWWSMMGAAPSRPVRRISPSRWRPPT